MTRAQLARMQIERRMMDFARGMLSQADSTMGQVGETLQFVREQLLAAGNGTLAPADRAMIAQQLSGMREELLALANQRDGSGAYLFGGQGSALPPFRADGTLATQVQAGEQQTTGKKVEENELRRTHLKRALDLMGSLLRDALVAATAGPEADLINADATPLVQRIAQRLAPDALERGLRRMIEYQTYVDRNVHNALLIENACLHMADLLAPLRP